MKYMKHLQYAAIGGSLVASVGHLAAEFTRNSSGGGWILPWCAAVSFDVGLIVVANVMRKATAAAAAAGLQGRTADRKRKSARFFRWSFFFFLFASFLANWSQAFQGRTGKFLTLEAVRFADGLDVAWSVLFGGTLSIVVWILGRVAEYEEESAVVMPKPASTARIVVPEPRETAEQFDQSEQAPEPVASPVVSISPPPAPPQAAAKRPAPKPKWDPNRNKENAQTMLPPPVGSQTSPMAGHING